MLLTLFLLFCFQEEKPVEKKIDPKIMFIPNQTSKATPHRPAVVEAVSLLGEPLNRIQLPAARNFELTKKLQAAVNDLVNNREDPLNHIWVGRREAYLGRYQRAVRVYTNALKKFPAEARLYRHRGHRYITLRQFDKAIADLERAASLTSGQPDEVEPDGMPNAANIPTSTTQTNIYYHLGLAYYLKGQNARALNAYKKCLALCKNNDMKVATLDWMYMTMRRLNMHDEAKALLADITPDMKLLESFSYHRRLLMYKGLIEPEALLKTEDEDADPALALATQSYGVGNYYLAEGKQQKARQILRALIGTSQWSSFGYIAAEADLARMGLDIDPWTKTLVAQYVSKQPMTQPFTKGIRGARRTRTAFVKLLEEHMGGKMGYKAALTSKPAQQRFGVKEPVFGVLLEKMFTPNGSTLPRTFGARPLFEGDLLVRVSDPKLIEARKREDVLAGIDAAYPFLELPDLIYGPGMPLTGPALTAVNAGGRKGVVGKAIYLRGSTNWAQQLENFTITLVDENGTVQTEGKGSMLLGHPLDAVLWLCKALREHGLTLDKGDLLSLGSATKLVPLTNQKTITARYENLEPGKIHEVTIHFSDESSP